MLIDVTVWLNEVLELSIRGYAVVIFVSSDVDAICCASMLSLLLRSQFSTIPVSSLPELLSEFRSQQQYHSRMVSIFFNCGSSVNLSSLISERDPGSSLDTDASCSPDTRVYVVDFFWPVNHLSVLRREQSIRVVRIEPQDGTGTGARSENVSENETEIFDLVEEYVVEKMLREVEGGGGGGGGGGEDSDASDANAMHVRSRQRVRLGIGPASSDQLDGDDSGLGMEGELGGADGGVLGISRAEQEQLDQLGQEDEELDEELLDDLRDFIVDDDAVLASDPTTGAGVAGGGGGSEGSGEGGSGGSGTGLDERTLLIANQLGLTSLVRRSREETDRLSSTPLDLYYDPRRARYGYPASWLVYVGAQIRTKNQDIASALLWQAIVGCTSAFLLDRVHPVIYREMFDKFESDAQHLAAREASFRDNPEDMLDADGGVGGANQLGMYSSGGSRGGQRSGTGISSWTSGVEENLRPGSISVLEKEVRLELYRHWSLYEALIHSDPIVSHFKTWTKEGLDLLHQRIAELGIELTELQGHYASGISGRTRSVMLRTLRNEEADLDSDDDDAAAFDDEMDLGDDEFVSREERAKIFRRKRRIRRRRRRRRRRLRNAFGEISNMTYQSFAKRVSVDLVVSAADFVHAIMSLMEERNQSAMASQMDGVEWEGNLWKSNFMKVYQLLKQTSTHGLQQKEILLRGLNSAIEIQKGIIRQANFVLRQRRTRHFVPFYFVHLTTPDLRFQSCMGLKKLALFLSRVLPKHQDYYVIRPLVVAANLQLPGQDHRVRLIGLDVNASGTNLFPEVFRKASELISVRIDRSFDSNIVEIDLSNLTDFRECLQYEYLKSLKEMKDRARRAKSVRRGRQTRAGDDDDVLMFE